MDAAQKKALLRQVQIEEYQRLLWEKYRRKPLAWMEERLGEPASFFKWSKMPGYENHKWDGDIDPIANAWQVIGDAYRDIAEGVIPDIKWVGIESATGCHEKGQLILMHDGSRRKVEDIVVGDLLMGDDSLPRRVIGLHRGIEQMVRIIPVKGASFVVNKSHVLSLKLTGGKPMKHRRHETFVDISVRDWQSRSKHFKHIYKLYRTGVDYPKKSLPHEPYFVGMWLGDGNADSSRITTIEPEVVDYLKQYAVKLGAILGAFDYGDRTPTYLLNFGRVGLRGNPINRWCRSLIVDGEKRIPFEYLTSDRYDRLELLAGLIDSDGCLHGKASYSYSTIYKGLAEDFEYLCRSLGFQCNATFRNNCYRGYYHIEVAGDCSVVPVKVLRKKAAKRRQKKDCNVTGFKVEELNDGEYFGFTVDGNHRYLMNDFMVTHNCSKTFFLARLVFWFLDCFPNSLVVTSAPKQDQLKLGLWSEISMLMPKIKRLRPEANFYKLRLAMDETEFDPNQHEANESDSWHCIGFVAGVGAEEQSAGKARGFHRRNMLIVLEECTGMPMPVLTAFQNTCTGGCNFIVAVGNPDSEFDPLHVFCQQKNVANFRISAFDYPNIVLNKEIFPGAATLSSIKTRSDTYGEGSPIWNAMVRGISPAQSSDSLIKLEWIENCIKKEFPDDHVDGFNAVGVDVANSEAGDKGATVFGRSNIVTDIYEFACPNASDLALNLIWEDVKLQQEGRHHFGLPKIKDKNISSWCVGVDSVGVGVSTINAAEKEGVIFTSLSGGIWDEAIPKEKYYDEVARKNKERPLFKFSSLRAQMYWEAREDLRLGKVGFAIQDTQMLNQLKKELCVPKVVATSAHIEVEKKEEIKKRLGGKSPNIADAFVYWNWMRKGYRRPNMIMPVMGGR